MMNNSMMEKTAIYIGMMAILACSTSSCSIYANYKEAEAAKKAEVQVARTCTEDRQFIADRLAVVHDRHEAIQANATVSGWIQENKAYIQRTDKWTGEAFDRLDKYKTACKASQYKELVAEMRTKHPYLFEYYNE
jgi:hypothetical protein